MEPVNGVLGLVAGGVVLDFGPLGLEEGGAQLLLCLFELTFADPGDMRPAIAGRRVYLAMAMDGDGRLKLKPQNLLLNLPLARLQ